MDRIDVVKKNPGGKSALIKWLLILCMLVTAAASYRTVPVKAAGQEVSLTLSSSEVQVGDWVEAELVFTSDTELAGVYAHITYDPTVLEYLDGDAEGDTGSLIISRMEENAERTLSYTLSFNAIGQGDTEIKVTETGMYNANAENIGSPTTSAALSVISGTQLSSNSSLQNLMSSYGTLRPAFASDIYDYSLEVPNEIDSVVLTAVASDPTAGVEIGGVGSLAVGENLRPVTVIAQDGSTSVYTVHVFRAESEESAEEESSKEESGEEESHETAFFKVSGMTLYLQSAPEDAVPPKGFDLTTITYADENYLGAIAQESDDILLYLTDFRGENGAFYYYDAEWNSCRKAAYVEQNGKLYVLLNAEEGDTVPENAHIETVEIGGYPVEVYIPDGSTAADVTEYIVYSKHDEKLYSYSTATRRLSEYVPPETEPEESSGPDEESAAEESHIEENSSAPASADSRPDSPQQEQSTGGIFGVLSRFSGFVRYIPYLMILLAVIALILLLMIIILAVSTRKRGRKAAGSGKGKGTVSQETRRLQSAAPGTAAAAQNAAANAQAPEDPEDIPLDPGAFESWRETTGRIPVSKMTEVHTTRFETITKILPDTNETDAGKTGRDGKGRRK